jgi:hypothetical protein
MNDYGVQEQAATIFIKAAQYIREYGWQVEGMSIDGQPRCSMGALASARPGRWDEDLAELMYSTLYDELNGISLTQFNHKYKSGEKVARLYERVATKLQSRVAAA